MLARRQHLILPNVALVLVLAGLLGSASTPADSGASARPAAPDGSSSSAGSAVPAASATLDYPPARRTEQVDIYHGQSIADPYRWMEEQESDETRAWVKAQDTLLEKYVAQVPDREALARRIKTVSDVTTYSVPVRAGKNEFFTRSEPGRSQPLLMVRAIGSDQARVLMDPEKSIKQDGITFGGFSPSRDGKYVAFAAGTQSGWASMGVLRVADGKELLDRVEGSRGMSAIWSHDGKGFFYMTYGNVSSLVDGSAEPVQKLAYHRLGDAEGQDETVFHDPARPLLLFSAKLSDDGRYMVLGLYDGVANRNQVAYLDTSSREKGLTMLISEADAGYSFEGNAGTRFFFLTDLDAPRSRIIAVNITRPERTNWEEVVPQGKAAMGSVSHIGNRLVVQSMEEAIPVVDVYGEDGKLQRRLELPSLGLIGGFADEPDSKTALYTLSNLFQRGTIFQVNLESGASSVHLRATLPYDPDDFQLQQVFFKSTDGTRVPMFVAHRKDFKADGTAPLYMYGYGHGGWQAFPWFQPHLLVFMEMGGAYALPGIRGGGEFGAQWREAGTRQEKLNTIADYIAAAEYLIKKRYTSGDRLVANGGSASGILPAVAIQQRPDLFGAAVIDFPFLDMLRYHEYTTFKGWIGGYGTSAEAMDYKILRSYSPLHNLVKGTCYPAVLTIVGEADTTTVPMHGYKYTAALQDAQGCDSPILLKEVDGAGHYSYGLTPAERHATGAEILAFMMKALAWKTTDPADTSTGK